jgi:preprotein translocase subunit SecA
MGILASVFGTRNERQVKRLRPIVERINSLRPTMEAKSDADMRAFTGELRQRLDNGAKLDDILPEAFAAVREGAWRAIGQRHYDVQLVGGIVLHQGKISEMRTGEGKTLTATAAAYLNALEGKGVHVVTVNDYLAQRDAEWMGRIYKFLGLSVGCIVHGLKDYERQRMYRSDICYGQNNEFGFDYLRDNMKMSPDRMVHRGLHYGIVDEVDSILIDEARTPLIISGPAEESAALYTEVDRIIPRLKRDIDYTVDEKAHQVMLTDPGVDRVQKLVHLDNLYDPNNIHYVHHVSQALRAHTLYKRDVNYLIDEGKIVIIDEFTGRKMPGRRWSDGLHQAIEAKEGVRVEEENQTLATVTFQNYFRMYKKLAGMTGTADTEATEFYQIYKLDVLVVPTNRPMIRKDLADLIYKNEKGKFRAVIDDIMECHERGQPVLVGTVSVEKSEVVASVLGQKKVPFNVLNAKNHGREARIIAQAGRRGAITISTNMAGRGTDIILGGNFEEMAKEALEKEIEQLEAQGEVDNHPYRGPEGEDPDRREKWRNQRLIELGKQFKEQCETERNQVVAAGGLKIVGTERHESRRIDNQLRGRAGRQGDPGMSRFYLSLQDDLLRIFGADRITGLMERLGMEEDVPIEAGLVTRAIEGAQKKVEGHNFDIRKNVLEYDDVMNQQRKTIYALRLQILEGRYAPEPSESEQKAGIVPPPPSQSGDWTVDALLADGKEDLRGWVRRTVERLRAAHAAHEQAGPPSPDDQPLWRVVRHDVWRQTGALLDIEKKMDGPAEELIDFIAAGIAASMIQQRERLYDLCDQVIATHVDRLCPPNTNEDDWDLGAMQETLRDQFNAPVEVARAATREELAEDIWEQVEERLGERESELGRPFLMYFTRHFLLEEVDSQWIDHLKVMDHLREGIYLRGYGQKDPKKEYKKEGYDLFLEMMGTIQVNALRNIFRVQVVREDAEVPELQQKQRKMQEIHPAAQAGDGAAAASGSQGAPPAADGDDEPRKVETVRRAEPKVGRNDPCPCGSGKKYKKCHGRTDAEASV